MRQAQRFVLCCVVLCFGRGEQRLDVGSQSPDLSGCTGAAAVKALNTNHWPAEDLPKVFFFKLWFEKPQVKTHLI